MTAVVTPITPKCLLCATRWHNETPLRPAIWRNSLHTTNTWRQSVVMSKMSRSTWNKHVLVNTEHSYSVIVQCPGRFYFYSKLPDAFFLQILARWGRIDPRWRKLCEILLSSPQSEAARAPWPYVDPPERKREDWRKALWQWKRAGATIGDKNRLKFKEINIKCT